MEQQQEVLTKLASDSIAIEESLRDKNRELFNQDLEIEENNREAEKNHKDHQDSVQYKEEIYSKYGNNQDRALKGKLDRLYSRPQDPIRRHSTVHSRI